MARKKQTKYVVSNEAGGVFELDELSPAILRHIELGSIELIGGPVADEVPAGDSADAPVED